MPQQGPSSTRYREFSGFQVVDGSCTKGDGLDAEVDAGATEEILLPIVREPSLAWEGSLDGSGGRRSGGCAVGTTPSGFGLSALLVIAVVLLRRCYA